MPNIGAPELVIVLVLLVAPLVGVLTLIDVARRPDAASWLLVRTGRPGW